MRNALLEVNDQLVDLPAKLSGVIKFQNAAAPLQDLDQRTGEYAWQFTLPFSRRNDAVFGQKAHAAALDKFFGRYTWRLRIEGQEWRGVLRLVSLKGGYVVALISEGFGWALALGEKKLTDLQSLPAIAYDGTQLESILALDCDATDVQFPLVSFGNFFGPPHLATQPDGTTKEVPLPASARIDYPLSVDDYYPSVYYVNLVRAILREAGFFAQGPVLDDADVRTWCVTAAGANSDAWPWGALLPASATNGRQNVDAYSYYDSDPLHTGSEYSNTAIGWDEGREVFFLPVPAPHVVSSPTRALDAPHATYTAPQPGSYTFVWSATISILQQTVDNHSSNPDFYNSPLAAGFRAVGLGMVVSRGGEGFTGADGELCTGGFYASGQDRVVSYATPAAGASVSGIAASVYLEPGDTVSLCLFAQRRFGGGQLVRKELYAQFSAVSFACTLFYDNQGNSRLLLHPADLLPPLAQRDVLRDFLLRANAVLVADTERGTATIDFRAGYVASQGPAVDLTDYVNPDDYEPLPVMGSAEALLFGPAEAGDDALLASAGAFDVVRIDLASAAAVAGTTKQVQGSFAAIVRRSYAIVGTSTAAVDLPTAASADTLKTPRSETDWDLAGLAPRVVRFLGQSAAGTTVPFQQRQVRFGLADYAGSLAWAGDAGAVAVRYAREVVQARRGHRLRVPAVLTPARYKQLSPGRRVWLGVAEYTVESTTNWDALDESAAAQVELIRVV